MQLHTFYEGRGLQSFLQTHANATMRVLCVEPTGKDIPSYLPEDTLTVCVDDILEAEYPRKHFTANHARKIAEYLLKACIDEVEFFIIYSAGNPYCLNGILKAIYKMFGEDKKAAAIMEFNALCYTKQLEHLDRLYRNADICLMHAAGETLTSIGEKYGLTKARTRQIPLESKPAFLYQSFESINETAAAHIINILEERIPEFRSKADLRGE